MARSTWKGPFVDGYLLGKAEASLAAHSAHKSAPQIPRGPALSVPRGRIVRH